MLQATKYSKNTTIISGIQALMGVILFIIGIILSNEYGDTMSKSASRIGSKYSSDGEALTGAFFELGFEGLFLGAIITLVITAGIVYFILYLIAFKKGLKVQALAKGMGSTTDPELLRKKLQSDASYKKVINIILCIYTLCLLGSELFYIAIPLIALQVIVIVFSSNQKKIVKTVQPQNMY